MPYMRRRRWLTAAAIAAALAVAGCSSGGSSSGGPAGGSPGAAAAAGTAITIGVICDCTGVYGATINAGAEVAQAWAKTVNAAGGLGGHQVQLTVDDDASNPATSVSDAQSLISAHVAAILDLSVLDAAWQKQVDAANIPVIGGNLNSQLFFADPNWYPAGGTNDATAESMVELAKQAGSANIGVFYCAEAPSCAQLVPVIKQLAASRGLASPYSAAISATAPNYTAQCVAAKQAGVGALFVAGEGNELVHVASDCAQQNYHPAFLEAGAGYGPAVSGNAAVTSSLWISFPITPYCASTPAVTAMNTAVDKYYPGLRTSAAQWTEFAAQGWAAGELIAQAVTAAGVPAGRAVTGAGLAKGLQSIQGTAVDGWTPPLTFTAGKPHPVDCWYAAKFASGSPSMLNGGKAVCLSGA
jgi:branched-chain amino acid transport system substrate-binding protein